MKMSAVATPEQEVGYQETITSQKKHFVSLAPYRGRNAFDGTTSFILFVQNCGENPTNISNNNVSMIFEGKTKEWASRKISILSYDDLMNKLGGKMLREESAARWAVQTYYYDVYDMYGNYYWTEIRRKESPAYGIAIHELGQLNRQMVLVEELVIKPQTLLPGENSGGLVVCDTRDMNDKVEGNFKVVVSVDDEEHEFTFSRNLYK
jgi:hypothetical protein